MIVPGSKEQTKKRSLSVSVRDLVEYTLRSGDLNLTFFSADRPVQGMHVHQSIQAARPAGYRPEVVVHHTVETDEYRLHIGGRIDGVYDDGRRVIIDEIKSTRKALSNVQDEEDNIHWGQAKCYACIYAIQNDLPEIDVQMTYYQVEEGERLEIRRNFATRSLIAFFEDLISDYLHWVDKIIKWRELRNRSIEQMIFPYPGYRQGQEEMINAASSAIQDEVPILIEAPTGIGKTMAVIFPAVQSLASGQTDRVFYLTARTTGKNTAEQCLEILRTNGVRCKYLSITAKEKICFNTTKSCSGEDCGYARGFYDRINTALADAFKAEDFTRERVVRIAAKHKVCPFEFSLELSLWVDVIICDYNYFFDPRVYLRRFFENGDGNSVVLVDEAHNLVERSREMYSAIIRREQVSILRKSLKKRLPDLDRTLGKVNTWMIRAREEIPEGETDIALEDFPTDLCDLLRKFTNKAEQWLSKNEKSKLRDEMLEFYFDVRRFLNTSDRYGTNYATYYSVSGSDMVVKMFCVDPSEHLTAKLEKCRSAVFFSATLKPVEYFAKLFGCRSDARALSLRSPFPSGNLCVLVAGKISALYRYREFTKHEVARMIGALVDRKQGNYLIFFPSYEYMKMVHTIFRQRRPKVRLVMQKPNMSEQERDDFLDNFSTRSDGFLTGFVVMGGFFAESIDLVGERLAGAAIVGVGFPQISVERELVKAYFDNQNGSGFAFAYQVPGMIKVLQAAGRVIRSEYDRGVIMLIDTRYTRIPYSLMFPEGWQPHFVGSVDKVGILLREFWKKDC